MAIFFKETISYVYIALKSRLYNSAFIKTSLISYLRQESVHGLFALYFCCREEVFSIGSIYVPVVCT